MKRKVQIIVLVIVFLVAIVTANLITTRYGPAASIYNAFFLIGLDLVTRDRLADFWGTTRWAKMGLLILAGSALSYAVNRDAAMIAEASAAAFAAAELVEATVYYIVRRRRWVERANIAATFGAAVDSLIFPTIAFGGVMWGISFGQFTAKLAGAFLWSLLILKLTRPPAVAPTSGIDEVEDQARWGRAEQ